MNWTAVTQPLESRDNAGQLSFPRIGRSGRGPFTGASEILKLSRWGHLISLVFISAPFPALPLVSIERFHSRGQHLCKFIGTKESVCIRKEFNSHRTGLGHQHGRRFIVLGHQYGRREVMWKHSIFNFHWLAVWRCPGGCHSQGCHGSSLHSAAVLGCTSFSGTLPLRSTHEFNIKYKI